MRVSIFGGLPLSCGSKTASQYCVSGLSNLSFQELSTLSFNTLKLLLYLDGKFWTEFVMCVMYIYPSATCPKLCNTRAASACSVWAFAVIINPHCIFIP